MTSMMEKEETMEKLKIEPLPKDYADNDLVEKMKKYYLSSATSVKYIRDLGISDQEVEDNISKIYDFAFDVEYCKKCPGVKKCAKANPLLCIKIVYDHGLVDRQLVPCKELLKQIAFQRQFVIHDFEDDWMDARLNTIDRNKGRGEALLKYVDFTQNKVNGWIYLTGTKNSGRSYFAAAITIDAARKEKGPICFLDSTLRLRELSDLSRDKKKEEFDKKLALYSNVPILVFDDFGNEFKSDYVRDAILFPILSTRASKKLLTIFTSDFTISEIQTLYGTSKAGEIRAKQLANLIKSMSDEEINLGEISIY